MDSQAKDVQYAESLRMPPAMPSAPYDSEGRTVYPQLPVYTPASYMPLPPQNPQNGQYPTPPPSYQANTQYSQPQPYPAQNMSSNITITAQSTTNDQQGGWLNNNQRNKPQSNAVGAATFIFLSGGMNLAWSLNMRLQVFRFDNIESSWFTAAIIGTVLGTIIHNRVHKKFILLFCSLLVIVGGIIFTSLPNDYDGITAALYMDGIGNGIAFVTAMSMIGEVSVKSNRGMIAASVDAMSFSLGIYIQLIYTALWTYSINEVFKAQRMHGILSILYGSLAAFMAFFLARETPVYHLIRNQEQEAIECIRRLQRPYTITNESYEILEEHKRMVALSNEQSISASIFSGLPALIKLSMYRGMGALTFSVVTTYAFTISAIVSSNTFVWPSIVYGTMRWVGALIAMFMIDSVGRKKITIFSILLCGGMMIGIGVCFDNYKTINGSTSTTALVLLFFLQFFAGFFVSSSSAYLTEAFPLAVKPYYIAFAFIVEMLVHIIILTTISFYFNDDICRYFYAAGALFFAFTVFSYFSLPETKRTTVVEAQNRFKSFTTPGCRS